MGSRSNSKFVRVLMLVTGVAAISVLGCSNSTCPDSEHYAVQGVVTDADGTPVPNAGVAIEYRLTFEESESMSAGVMDPEPEMVIAFDVPETADVRVWVTDYRGASVVTLMDEELLEPDHYTIRWPWTDDDGHRVPDGLYYLHLTAGDRAVTNKLFVEQLCDGMAGVTSIVKTDAEGRFAIDWSIVPVGGRIESTDSWGRVIGHRIVLDSIQVCAWSATARGSEPAVLQPGETIAADVVVR